MKHIKLALHILIMAISTSMLHADNRIVFFINHAPDRVLRRVEQEANQMKLSQKIAHLESKTPGDISQKLVKNALRASLRPKLSGILAMYGGYMDISDSDGLISFPKRQVTQKLYFAITPRIQLIKIKGNTFAHREYITERQNPTVIYSFELKQDEKKYSYWDVKEESIPQDKIINPITVVIVTNPKNIYVEQGQFMANQNVQLVLPDNIYITGRIHNEQALLNALDIKRYFELITIDQKKAADLILQKMITNL